MATDNKNITFKGSQLSVLGEALTTGSKARPFKLTGTEMQDVTLQDFSGKTLILSVVPSLDTPVCAIQTKRFNSEAASLGDKVDVLTVSLDLPFAQKRWCGAEGVDRVKTASDYKYRSFGENYGAYIQDLGLLARAVFVVDKHGTVKHAEYVSEISAEPDYDAALKVAREVSA